MTDVLNAAVAWPLRLILSADVGLCDDYFQALERR